ncbi:MAG: hypothetical protein Kow00122_13560 [Thermoleophilia bacterium]
MVRTRSRSGRPMFEGSVSVVRRGADVAWSGREAAIGETQGHTPQWMLAVDLDLCTGCQACVAACFAENNIGVSGGEQVAMGRGRHWIKVERYWERSEFPDVKARFLPLMCQQCGNAPCEPVCPVFASVHSKDGLNSQVYNRCIGTRYCAQNCPYKVRVFNFFAPEFPAPLEQQLNPDVTVRPVGIMEKCTFCVQRIRRAREEARVEGRELVDGEIVPACAQTCPPGAIVFGDGADPESRVAKLFRSERGFRLFESLNTKPSVVYLGKGETRDG